VSRSVLVRLYETFVNDFSLTSTNLTKKFLFPIHFWAFLGEKQIFFRSIVLVFGFQHKCSIFGKKYAEYSVKTNYLADTEYSVSVKSQIFGYLVRPVVGCSLFMTPQTSLWVCVFICVLEYIVYGIQLL
jgi:hypothetical protein